jgi:hypothetical protein
MAAPPAGGAAAPAPVGMMMITAEDIAHVLKGRRTKGQWVCQCPAHEDRRASLAVRDGDDGRVLLYCHAGCDPLDVIDALKARGLWNARERAGEKPKPTPPPARLSNTSAPANPSTDNCGIARWLWQRSRPIQGSIAELYLRCERGISCPLPSTLRFLPANDKYPPSMIAPFVIPDEPEPGKLAVNTDHVEAVHITRLTPDGRKHSDEPNKIMLGSAPGVPIVVAPMNDLLGLAITEGIEDALSVHQAFGLGAWAAGTAGRMPALAEAVPDYCDCVIIFEDADTAGIKHSMLLAEALNTRNIAVEIVSLAQVPR